MCVILCFDEKSNLPTLEILELAEKSNNHGGGIAWLVGEKIKWKKGLSAKEIFDLIQTENIKANYIIHFRIKSSGSLDLSLCHPMPIKIDYNSELEGLDDEVLFHNGTWNSDDWKQMMLDVCIQYKIKVPDGHLSDTRAMSFLASVIGNNFLSLVTDNFGKVAILSKNGVVRYGENWHDEKGMLCSNDYFLPTVYESKFDTNWYEKFKKAENRLKDDILEKTEIEKQDRAIELQGELSIMQCSLIRLTENLTELKFNVHQSDKITKKIKSTQTRIIRMENKILETKTQLEDIYQNSTITDNFDYDSDFYKINSMEYGF